jgi:hypothetical protein
MVHQFRHHPLKLLYFTFELTTTLLFGLPFWAHICTQDPATTTVVITQKANSDHGAGRSE